MEPREYVDARWSALVRAAVLLGASEVEAPDLVRRVLADNQRRIRRARDPDPVVHRALAAAIPHSDLTRFGAERDLETRREMLMDPDQQPAPAPVGPLPTSTRRRWPLVAAVATVLVAAASTVAPTTNDDDRRDARRDAWLAADQVPSLFAYDAISATAMLGERGLDVTLEPRPACQVKDRVVASDPPTGATYSPGDPITLYVAVPADVTCLTTYPDIETAWQFVDFANDRGPAPAFARRVIVYVADGPRVVLTGADDAARWDETGVLAVVRQASERVALLDDDPPTYALPTLRVHPSEATTDPCAGPDPPVTAPGEALSVLIRAPANLTSCPVRVDLFRNRGLIDAVVLYPAVS
jgi:hypothetical protein